MKPGGKQLGSKNKAKSKPEASQEQANKKQNEAKSKPEASQEQANMKQNQSKKQARSNQTLTRIQPEFNKT